MYEDRIKWIQHNGRRILSLDYSNFDVEKLPEFFEEVKKAVSKEPPNSVLYLVNVRDLKFSLNVLNMFNKLAEETKPYDKGGAILNVKGLVKVMYDAYSKIFTKPIRTFDNTDKALEWLSTL